MLCRLRNNPPQRALDRLAGRSHLLTKSIQICATAARRAVRNSALAALVFAVTGLDAGSHAQERRVTLSVRPLLCITDSREEPCELSILVTWRSDRAGSFCLHNELSSEPIQCWQRAASGMVVEERAVRETFSYWLTDGLSDARLAEATLDVMTTESGDRRRHRPRRHVWDIL
jgi:hypothetical protein